MIYVVCVSFLFCCFGFVADMSFQSQVVTCNMDVLVICTTSLRETSKHHKILFIQIHSSLPTSLLKKTFLLLRLPTVMVILLDYSSG